MDAGKWLATERGAFDLDEQIDSPPVRFPLAERLRVEELVALAQLRERLQQ